MSNTISGKLPPVEVTADDARYAFEIVRRVCDEVGPGSPGSPQERQRAAVFHRELAAHLGQENVSVEEFTLSPGAFLGAQQLSGLLLLVAALLNFSLGRVPAVSPWITAAAALALAVMAVAIYLLEFIFSREFVDPLFRKAQSVNVIGWLRPAGTTEVRRLLILSGHHDSALENTWLRSLGYGFLVYSAVWLVALFAVLVLSAIQLAGLIFSSDALVRIGSIGWITLAFLVAPAFIYAMFFNMGRKDGGTVPGAVDNLSGSALAVAMCRLLVNNPGYVPPDTEVRFISFGGEEAGMRGSRRYVERHRDELMRLDARLLNFEMVADPEIGILISDINGTVKHSAEMVAGAVAAAERAGVPHRVMAATLGIGTDAAPFSRAGLQATTLMPFKIPEQLVAFYHQKWDGPEVVKLEPLHNVLRLAVEWARCGGEQAKAMPIAEPTIAAPAAQASGSRRQLPG
jgi:hypothetical protein